MELKIFPDKLSPWDFLMEESVAFCDRGKPVARLGRKVTDPLNHLQGVAGLPTGNVASRGWQNGETIQNRFKR